MALNGDEKVADFLDSHDSAKGTVFISHAVARFKNRFQIVTVEVMVEVTVEVTVAHRVGCNILAPFSIRTRIVSTLIGETRYM